jgi:hypothetical protein
MTKVLAVISFIDQQGRPVDPGFGGGIAGSRPDQGLPGYGHPDQDLPWHGHADNDLPGRRPYPGHDLPGRRPHPGNRLPWAPVTTWPPEATDPDWGVGAPIPDRPDQPIYIPIDGHPGNVLPPVHGHPAPPIATTPPGTIWPPLPPGAPSGKAAVLVWIVGVGWRYTVIDLGARPNQPIAPGAAPK